MAAVSSTTTTVVQPPVAAAAPPADGGFDIGGDAMPADVGGQAPQPDAPQDGGDAGDGDVPAGDPAVQQPDNPGAAAPAYQYSSAPRAISGGTATGAMSATRQKYRDPATVTRKANIMHDKRVIRGNTRAAQVPTASQKIILDEEQKKLMRRRAAAEARRKKVLEEVEKTPYDPLTAPVEGRAHMTIQTDEHQLEEITDKPTEADVSTQTEDDVDAKPLPPLFMPKPPGRDQQTSIEPGELFDFNLSVEPILEVLIGKTLDQALTEVLEEQELSALKAQRAWFEQQKATELAQVQQLEAEAKRKFEEKEARMREARTRALAEQRVQEKNAAQLMAKQFLSTLQDNTLNKLESAGHFYDPVRRDVEHTFMPWLLDATQRAVGARSAARAQLDDLLRAAMAAAQKNIDETLRKRREAKDQAERDRLSAIAAAESARLAALQAAADAAAREVAERVALEESLKKRAAAAEEAAAQAKADAKAEAKKKRDAELRKKLGALAE